VRRPNGKRPPKLPRHMLENNMNIRLRDIEWGDIDWTGLTQDRD
jgi:hypothetical protein